MGLIFMSHSSRDNAEAVAMRDWLATEGWDEVFLDLDPSAGLAPGQRWRDELRRAGECCSAVVVLISPHWAASKWCLTEFLLAAQLGKEIFPVLIAPCPLSDLPVELTATYQFADIATPGNRAAGLERLRIGLQRAGLHPGAFPWPPNDEPRRPIFRGLRVLEEKDAAIFFGRDVQITKALDTIRRLRDGAPERMLAILGASGAGKSSFLRAGLLARLKRDTERFLVLPTVRPGRAALTGPSGLRRALGLSGSLDPATIAARFATLRAPVVERQRNHAPRPAAGVEELPPPTVVLPIDQAEELFVAGDDEAAVAVTVIVDAVGSDPGLLLLVTIRSDSFSLLQSDPLLSGVPRLPFDLPRLPSAAFKEIIEGPTRLPGAGIEIDADLTELLIRDFEGADALPLLAFTLERLTIEHGADGRIDRREYADEMEGVGGAIRKAVEVAFAEAADIPGLPRSRAELDAMAQRTFVPGLVRIDDVGAAPKRRVALRRQLPQEALPLVDCLVDQRLLVTNTTGTESTVEVSHEAVLRHWPELEGWIAERRADLALSERVTAAAREWRAAGSSAGQEALVHRGERLRTAEKLLLWDDLRRQMGDDAVAYLAACREAETRAASADAAQRRRQQTLLAAIAATVVVAAFITLVGAVVVIASQRNIGRQQSLTIARAAEAFASTGDYLRAMRLSIIAAHSNALAPASPEASDGLALNASTHRLAVEFRGHDGLVGGARLSADERRLLTWGEDGTARLWDATNGLELFEPLKHMKRMNGATFSPDETKILTWSDDGTARLWDTATGKEVGQPLVHPWSVDGAAFSHDKRFVLTWSADEHAARLWRAETGTQFGNVLRHDDDGEVIADGAFGARFSSDDTRVLTWSNDRTVRVWDTATSRQTSVVLKHDNRGDVQGAAFSTDDTRILTWSEDGTARVWDARTGRQIAAMRHDREVAGAAFSADGREILTWSADTARIWSASTGGPVSPPLKHDGWVNGAVLLSGTRVLTASKDGKARVWDRPSGPLSTDWSIARDDRDTWTGRPFAHQQPVPLGLQGAIALASPDEHEVLTVGDDGFARLWDLSSGGRIGPPLKHDAAITGATFARDGGHLLTWGFDGTVRMWDAATRGQVGASHDWQGVVLSPDRLHILGWTGKVLRRWDAVRGAPIGQPLSHKAKVLGAAFSRDARSIVTWSAGGSALVWSTARGAQLTGPLTHDSEINGAMFSNDGSEVVTWSSDRTARRWDVSSGRLIGSLQHQREVTGTALSADDGLILTWSTDDTARVWSRATGNQIGPVLAHDQDGRAGRLKRRLDSLLMGEHTRRGGGLFARDGHRVLTWSEDGLARLWSADTWTSIGKALEHGTELDGAAFVSDERHILTWGDGSARLWDAESSNAIGAPFAHSGPIAPAFSADGQRILTWDGSGNAHVWSLATRQQVGPTLHHHGRFVQGAVFSRTEHRIVTWGGSATIIWHAGKGTPTAVLDNGDDTDRVRSIMFSKDEESIVTISDKSRKLWNVRWAMRDVSDKNFVADVCREMFMGSVNHVQSPASGREVAVGIRHLDLMDTDAAPILRGREGEDVCAPPPTTWQTLLSLASRRSH